jgi:site-specific recombinase XerD
MTDEHVRGFFHRLSALLGQCVSAHRLRHRMATHLAGCGDYKTLQEILGHTSITATMGYAIPDVERMRAPVPTAAAVRSLAFCD